MLKKLKKLFRNQKVNNTSGPNGVLAHILKELQNAIVPTLTAIYTQNLQYRILPPDWLNPYYNINYYIVVSAPSNI